MTREKQPLRRLVIAIAVLVLVGCAGYLAGCGGQTGTTSPVPVMGTSGPAVMLPGVWRCTCDCATPTPTPPPTTTVTIYDCSGAITDTLWLTSTFGAVTWDGLSLNALRCSIGPAVLVAHVQDAEGVPVEGATVVLWYSSAPMLPLELRQCGLDRGVYGPTNQGGDIGFGLGAGSYYFPPAGGPHRMWVVGADGCLAGLGMIAATEHQHLDSAWTLPGAAIAGLKDWGYSTGAVVYPMDHNGVTMWVIEAK